MDKVVGVAQYGTVNQLMNEVEANSAAHLLQTSTISQCNGYHKLQFSSASKISFCFTVPIASLLYWAVSPASNSPPNLLYDRSRRLANNYICAFAATGRRLWIESSLSCQPIFCIHFHFLFISLNYYELRIYHNHWELPSILTGEKEFPKKLTQNHQRTS